MAKEGRTPLCMSTPAITAAPRGAALVWCAAWTCRGTPTPPAELQSQEPVTRRAHCPHPPSRHHLLAPERLCHLLDRVALRVIILARHLQPHLVLAPARHAQHGHVGPVPLRDNGCGGEGSRFGGVCESFECRLGSPGLHASPRARPTSLPPSPPARRPRPRWPGIPPAGCGTRTMSCAAGERERGGVGASGAGAAPDMAQARATAGASPAPAPAPARRPQVPTPNRPRT